MKIRFVVGTLTADEFNSLKLGHSIISKMLLVPDDYKLFHYKEGDEIEAETQDGDRIWTTIRNLEVVQDETRAVVILTLYHKRSDN